MESSLDRFEQIKNISSKHNSVWNLLTQPDFTMSLQSKKVFANDVINLLIIRHLTIEPLFCGWILKWFAGLFCCLRIFINSLQVFLIP